MSTRTPYQTCSATPLAGSMRCGHHLMKRPRSTFVPLNVPMGGESYSNDSPPIHVYWLLQANLGCEPRRTRTFNPLIKSQLLCQLS